MDRWRPYRRGLAAFALSLVLCSCMEGRAFCGWSLSRIVGRCAPSVVRVVAMDAQDRVFAEGTGFFLDESGRVATAFHLVQKASRVVVETYGRERGEFLEVVAADPKRDLLIARTTLKETRAVFLGDSPSVFPGEEVLVLGISPGGEAMLSPGSVVSVHRLDDLQIFRMTAPILPGWSGAPVFNAEGEAIAVAVAFLEEARDLNFGIPVEDLRRMKPLSLALHELPEKTVRLEAALREGSLVELLLGEARAAERTPPREGAFTGGAGLPSRGDSVRMGAGVVHFRNGRSLRVEQAWREGDRMFLVMPGKSFAVSYDLHGISRFEERE